MPKPLAVSKFREIHGDNGDITRCIVIDRFIYLPDERLPRRGNFDYGLTMRGIYG